MTGADDVDGALDVVDNEGADDGVSLVEEEEPSEKKSTIGAEGIF